MNTHLSTCVLFIVAIVPTTLIGVISGRSLITSVFIATALSLLACGITCLRLLWSRIFKKILQEPIDPQKKSQDGKCPICGKTISLNIEVAKTGESTIVIPFDLQSPNGFGQIICIECARQTAQRWNPKPKPVEIQCALCRQKTNDWKPLYLDGRAKNHPLCCKCSIRIVGALNRKLIEKEALSGY